MADLPRNRSLVLADNTRDRVNYLIMICRKVWDKYLINLKKE